jgi:tetrahydromethanopterin S-methyltransferase subunit G
MSELDRIIGRLENGFEGISARLKKIENKLDKLEQDYQQRLGGRRVLYILSAAIGTVSGIIGAAIKSFFTQTT